MQGNTCSSHKTSQWWSSATSNQLPLMMKFRPESFHWSHEEMSPQAHFPKELRVPSCNLSWKLQKSFLSSLQRVFNTIRKVHVNCSLEISRWHQDMLHASCFGASSAHQDRNRTKTASINMTAPQHHIETTFSTHPTVDNFEANMFHLCSRLAVKYNHNLLSAK